MKIASFMLLIFILLFGLIYFLTGYKSAFEADQSCHSLLKIDYAEQSGFGCDHDLETRQWLLFQEGINQQPALVLKRFRY